MARINFQFADGFIEKRRQDTSVIGNQYLENIILFALRDRRHRWRHAGEFWRLAHELRANQAQKKYTIANGDTLDSICTRAGYGQEILYYLNPGINFRMPEPGTVINLPPASDIGTSENELTGSVIPTDATVTDEQRAKQVQEQIQNTGAQNTVAADAGAKTLPAQDANKATQNTNAPGSTAGNTGTTEITNASYYNPEEDLMALDSIPVPGGMQGVTVAEDTQTELIPATVPLLTLPADRSDIVSIYRELSATQKEKYFWTDVLKTFTDAQPKTNAANVATWARKKLKEGWNFGDPVPLLMVAEKTGEKNGAPIIEAYSFSSAWQYADKTLHLPKNADAPFYWQRKFSGKQSYHFLNYSSNTAWQNFVNLKDHADWNAAQLLLDVSGDQGNYDAVLKIKNYNDQLLSESFVNLVISGQSVLYANATDADAKITGVFTETTRTDLQNKKTTVAVAVKKAADEEALLFREIGVPTTPTGINKFKRTIPGQVLELKANRSKLSLLKAFIRTATDPDDIVDFITDNHPAGDAENKAMFYLLNHIERIKALEAFEKEIFLAEPQEKIVNQLIEYTPIDPDPTSDSVTNMRTELWKWLNENNKYHYNELIEDQDNDDTRRGFYAAAEEVSVQQTGGKAEVNKTSETQLLAWAENPAAGLLVHEELYGMSERQLADVGFTGKGTERKFDPHAFRKIVIAETTFMLANPIRGGEALYRLLKFGGENWYVKFFLGYNNNEWLEKVQDAMGDDLYQKLLTDRFNTLFANDAASRATAVTLIGNSKALGAGRDWEVYLAALPSTAYAGMTADEQADLIMKINNGNYTDGTDEETILRIIDSAGMLAKTNKPGKTPEEEKAETYQYDLQRLQLHAAINKRDAGYVKLKAGFQMDNEDALLLKLNNLAGKFVETSTFETAVSGAADNAKDDVIRSMPFETMAKLTIEKREEFIRIMLGRSAKEDMLRAISAYGDLTGVVLFTRVGKSDEEAMIRLINSTPATQVTDLLAWMQANHGEFYNELHSAIDGDEFKQLHNTLDTLATSKLETETANDPARAEQLKAQREEMIYQGAAHKKVVPWADPGFFKQFYADTSYEFIVNWDADNNIVLHYYDPREWKGGLRNIKQKGPYSPWEYIGVEFLEDDSDLNGERGEIRMMPAIYLFFLNNKQTQRQIGEALDLVFLAVGIGELAAAAKLAQMIIAAIDIALTAASLITNSYKEELPKDLKAAFDVANMAFSFYQVAKLGKALVSQSWEVVESFIKQVDEALLSGKLTGGAAKTMQAEAERFKKMKEIAEQIDDADLDELRAMQKKVNESNLTASQKSQINVDLGARIKANEHGLKYEAEKQAIADSNKTVNDAGAVKTDMAPVPAAQAIDTQKAVATATDNGNAFHIKHPEWGNVQFIRRDGKWFLVNAKTYPDDIRIKIAQRYSPENMDKLRDAWLKTKDPNAIKNADEVIDAGGDGVKTVNGPEKVKEPEAVKEPEKTKEPEAVKEDVNAKGVDETKLTEAELQKIEDDLLAQEGARTWRDEAAEEFLAKQNAKAMYIPGEPGKPGVLVFSRNATRAEVLEEIKHLKQHKSLKFASLTTEEIIKLEIEAQQQLSRYAKMKGWSDAEIKQFDNNLKYWEAKKAEYAKGGDAAKAVDAEVGGFKMADENNIIIKRYGSPPTNSNFMEMEISKLTKIHDAPKAGHEPTLAILENKLKQDGWDLDHPIPIVELPDGALMVVDGHHRILIMENFGQKTVPIDVMSPRDAKYKYGEQDFATLVEIGKQSGYYKGSYIPTPGLIHERAVILAKQFLDFHFPKK